ncbi:type II secretion system protein GspM [Candidatus Thiodictyon syntrophicum]|jgi:general secretion pathway protein M|uniref:General secretion pathway protein GspM n=1 Tax=Candidatus Thiodictyon syntrophicum TaxID=1166950 RepID=A0A2K8U319_9GAMM|nr:type II secretion system protein GspM [Candidatus Thiodictyon syntrophicum]AUB79937.1 general secretion pathway protein GspM [Candidatus Thiodictyon syntrophicum]
MTQANPTKRYCVLVWGAAILLPSLLIAAIAIPWLGEVRRLGDAIAAGSEQLGRYQRLIATLPGLRAELEKVNSNQDFKAFYFDAPTPDLAGAELTRKVQDIVTAAHGRLISTQLLPEEKAEQPARVRLRVQIQGTTDILLEVLYELDQARPFLFVEQVSVRSSARGELPEQVARGRAGRRPSAINEAGELTVRLDVFGFALGGKA